MQDEIIDSAACSRTDGTSICGRLKYTLKDLESFVEITTFPHKGILWDEKINVVTFWPQSTDPIGLHKVLIAAYLPSIKDVLETAEITYFVYPAPYHHIKNEEQPEPLDTGKLRRILSLGQGFCTNPTTMFDLFNTGALAEQSSFFPGTS